MKQLQDINIFWKIFLALLLVGLVSTLSISSLSYLLGEKNLELEAFRKLTAIREAKANHIEHEMREIRNQVATYSEDFMVVQAMKDFKEGFAGLEKEAADDPGAVARARQELTQFYEKHLLPGLNAHAASPYFAEELAPASPAALLLQARYIAANPNPVGEKQLLTAAADNSLYSRAHRRYHGVFLNFLRKFSYSDIFLIDAASGRIVYSVTKEVDLGKSVEEPIFRNTTLAETFRKSVAAPGKDFQNLADFANYYPSYNTPASFISAPIYDGDEKIGVLAFQMPIERINNIMTNEQRWEDIGLGKSGETYLVGSDFTLRSQSRFFLTDKEHYLRTITQAGMVPAAVIASIRDLGTTIGLQPVRTPGARMALTGKAGEMTFADYRGIPVLSSFQPLKVDDVRWALLSEIDRAEAHLPIHQLQSIIAAGFAGLLLLIVIFARFVSRFIASPLISLAALMEEVETSGDLSLRARESRQDEIGRTITNFHSLLERWAKTLDRACENTEMIVAADQTPDIAPITPLTNQDALGIALSDMDRVLRRYHRQTLEKRWHDTGQALLNDRLRGEQEPAQLAHKVLEFLTSYLDAQMGLFYLSHANGTVEVAASYAFPAPRQPATAIAPGDGLVGQVLLAKKATLLSDLPEEYAAIGSGLGEQRPRHLLVTPLLFNDQVEGIIELATLHPFTPPRLAFLEQASESIAIAIASAKSRIRNRELLEYSQHQAEKLQNQTEELRNQTEELQNQTAELEAQQGQLKITNDELAQRSRLLEEQRNEIVDRNASLEEARKLLELKAAQLAETNRYKSEFLANMSHELRTPMNSILVLSQSLLETAAAALPAKQLQYLQTIHESGQGLLTLINDILDVSKMEAGKMTVHHEEVVAEQVAASLTRMFMPLATRKGLELKIETAPGVPVLTTDRQRLEQILRNFLGNAVKFTESGFVHLRIDRPDTPRTIGNRNYPAAELVAFSVRDSGIGIARDKQELIFEPFRQQDGSTSRIYGGTGLGLAISSEFAKLLGGAIELESEPGRGSTFTLLLPLAPAQNNDAAAPATDAPGGQESEAPPTDAAEPAGGPTEPPAEARPELAGKTVLVVDDDMRNIYSLGAVLEPHDIEMVAANNGQEALELLKANCRINAVIMDIMMPKMDGYQATREIRAIKALRDIPIIVLTAKVMKDERERCLAAGANEYLPKPLDRENLLSVLQVWLYDAKNRCALP